MNQLPIDTICLLPTCYLCKINAVMLDKIDRMLDEIVLIADVECAPAMKKRVHKILKDKDDKVSES